MRNLSKLALISGIAAALVACETKAPAPAASAPAATKPAAAPAKPAAATLKVFSGRKEALVGPLFTKFTAATGIKVDVEYNTMPVLTNRLLTEGEKAGVDVFYAQESGYLGSLAKASILAEIPSALSSKVEPAFRAENGRWLGISGRARVLVASPTLTPEQLPKTLKELGDPKWKGKLGWAPGNGSMHAHVSVLRHVWGEAETEAWLKAVVANEAKVYPKNSPQVQAVADGEVQLGWVNHYYLHKLGLKDKARNVSFPTDGDAGNVMMVSATGVPTWSKNKEQAFALLKFLVGEEAQKHLTQDNFEYPARTGATPHPDIPALDTLKLAKFDPANLADVGPTLALLQKLGLQ